MARPSYPSDDARRKVRPHVKVHLTVASHPRTAAVWADLEMRAMLVELWRIAYEAFAGRTGGRVALSPAAVHSITGRERHFTGVARLRTLCSRLDYECVTEGSATFVTVRNFAIKQDPGSAARGVTPPTPDPSYSSSTSDTERREEKSPETPAPQARPAPELRLERPEKPRKKAASYAPDALPSDDLADLQGWTLKNIPGLAPYVDQLVATCLDHFRGEGRPKADWKATCRNWIRKDAEYRQQQGGPRGALAAPVRPPTKSWADMTFEEKKALQKSAAEAESQRAARMRR